VAIVAETGTVAYFYRDQLAGIVKKISKETHVQEVTSVPTQTESEIQGVAPSAAVASLLPSVTVSISPTEPEIASTPIPALVEGGVTNTSNTVIANSTPAPNGNNGHHYGQTPKPERTKEPKNGGNPRDNSKPTKAK
jgi:hypothetical protein